MRSELVEAVTLNRKQIELLARLNELDEKKLKDLVKKTPQQKSLKTKLNVLHGGNSECAHSSTYASMSLLGEMEGRIKTHGLLYPEFNENTEVIFENWIFIF
ncbi:MAG: hypothetical protein QNK15_06860, partial [Cycloclasticus sp.]|nr:hypothetical protein [Cycloclasticus sp.]